MRACHTHPASPDGNHISLSRWERAGVRVLDTTPGHAKDPQQQPPPPNPPPQPGSPLHLHQGPIDLLIRAWGAPAAVARAYEAATTLFPTILPALVAELPHLRTPLPTPTPHHPIARAMHQAVTPHVQTTITPMAAVAGAIADAVLAAMTRAAPLDKALVNNGGDIALHLAPTQSLRCAIVTDLASPALDATILLHAAHPSRGLATSGRACKGRGGRSFSFGIADSVTVLAATAARADAAATVIANAVDLPGHPAITRRPATDIDPDSDLGDRLITWDLAPVPETDIDMALDAGRRVADALIRSGLVHAAFLALRGRTTTCLPATMRAA